MDEAAINQLADEPVWTIIEQLNNQPDVLVAMTAYSKLVKHFHWQQKNLPLLVAVGWAGIQYGLIQAKTEPERAHDIQSWAKTIAYDVASFAWPGWDEPGLTVDPTAQFLGLESARLNLRLALDLGKGDLPTSRAYWLLGAHLLAAGDFEGAGDCFGETAVFAQKANAPAEAVMAEGYSAITDLLANPADRQAHVRLDRVKVELAALEDGPFFVEQLDTAYRVFAS